MLRNPAAELHGKPVQLSNGEFELLSAFLKHPRRVQSRNQFLDFARGRQADLYDRCIDVQVGRLRRRQESDPKQPEIIKTVHGAGYMFTLEVQHPRNASPTDRLAASRSRCRAVAAS